ncbi:MAG: LysR family transcriptional regulator [Marinicellaceae bacterium]
MSQFEEMQNFIRVVEAGSITKAADQTDTVKSAVSRRLAELERRLGVSLLARTTRSQSLTETGRSYYLRCLQIIDDVAELESSIKDEQCALRGKIKVAVPLSFGLTHLAPALNQFNLIHPDIHLNVDFNDRKVDIIEEGFDLAFRIAELEDSNLIARKITSVRLILLASPSYIEKFGLPNHPQDLAKNHVKVQYKDSPESLEFNLEGKTAQIRIPSVLHSNNGDYLCQAAIAGKGIILTPDFICYKFIKNGQLIPILSQYLPKNEIGAYAIYPQNRHLSKRVRSLVDYLIEYFGQEPYWKI